MADRKAAPAPPEAKDSTQEPEELAPALPDLPHRAWTEVELLVGALREHWTEGQRKQAEEIEAARRIEEVTDNA